MGGCPLFEGFIGLLCGGYFVLCALLRVSIIGGSTVVRIMWLWHHQLLSLSPPSVGDSMSHLCRDKSLTPSYLRGRIWYLSPYACSYLAKHPTNSSSVTNDNSLNFYSLRIHMFQWVLWSGVYLRMHTAASVPWCHTNSTSKHKIINLCACLFHLYHAKWHVESRL